MVLGISSLIFISNVSSPVVPDVAMEVLDILFGFITFKMAKGHVYPDNICHKLCLTYDFRDDLRLSKSCSSNWRSLTFLLMHFPHLYIFRLDFGTLYLLLYILILSIINNLYKCLVYLT